MQDVPADVDIAALVVRADIGHVYLDRALHQRVIFYAQLAVHAFAIVVVCAARGGLIFRRELLEEGVARLRAVGTVALYREPGAIHADAGWLAAVGQVCSLQALIVEHAVRERTEGEKQTGNDADDTERDDSLTHKYQPSPPSRIL